MFNERKESVLQEAGKYCLDISKLVFGGVILAGIMRLDVDKYVLFSVDIIIVAFFAALGLNIISLSKKFNKK